MSLRRAVCAIVAVVLAGACSGAAAPEEARRFLATLYPGRTFNTTCQQYDSDNDGYVSCTAVERVAVVRMEGDALPPPAEPLALECSATLSCSSGCRMQRARINQ